MTDKITITFIVMLLTFSAMVSGDVSDGYKNCQTILDRCLSDIKGSILECFKARGICLSNSL